MNSIRLKNDLENFICFPYDKDDALLFVEEDRIEMCTKEHFIPDSYFSSMVDLLCRSINIMKR